MPFDLGWVERVDARSAVGTRAPARTWWRTGPGQQVVEVRGGTVSDLARRRTSGSSMATAPSYRGRMCCSTSQVSRSPSDLHSCMMIRCSWGCSAEKRTNSATTSRRRSRLRRPAGRRLAPERPGEVVEELSDGGPPQLLLAAEVVGEQRLLDPGPLGDQPGARPLEGPLGEQLEGGGEDPFSRVASAEGRCVRTATVARWSRRDLIGRLKCLSCSLII